MPMYHGTHIPREEGDLISPGHESVWKDQRPETIRHVHFTQDSCLADDYAWAATHKRGLPGNGHVYEVEPTGPVKHDPEYSEELRKKTPPSHWRSEHPLRVVRRISSLAVQAAGSEGDRFVTCSKGHEHWGAHGAAGLLVRHKGDDGKVSYLLQKRSDSVDHPGQWSIPSGAKGKDETPEQGALREYREEMGPLPQGTKIHHVVKSTDCGDWAFHTVVADAPEQFMPRGKGETEHEVAGAAWHTPHEIKGLDLHPAFAKSWDQVRRSKGPVTAASRAHWKKPPETRTGQPATGALATTSAGEWQTGHRPEHGPGLHEIAGHPDIDLDFASYYGPAHEVRSKIESLRGKPDEPVTVYRAGGEPRHGDWVSLTRHFAEDHASQHPDMQVHEATVPAGHVRYAYSDWIDEAGYFPGHEKTAAAEGCGHCGDHMGRHRQADVMYHQSPAWNRKSIGVHGLVADMSEDEIGKGTYMSPRPSGDTGGEDVWRVNTRGMTLHPDDPGNMHEFRDVGGSYWTEHDIPADRLTLHHQGTARTAAAMEAAGEDEEPTYKLDADDDDDPDAGWFERGIHHEAAASDRTVAIVLDVPQRLIHNVDEAVDYGTHVTIAYCGKDLDDDGFEEVLRRAEDAARRQPGPLTGTLSGLGTFPPSKSSDGKVPVYIPANIPGIQVLRNRLEDLSVSEHKGYIPHVTLRYCEPGEELPPPHHEVPITFTHLTVRRGNKEAHRFPFGG